MNPTLALIICAATIIWIIWRDIRNHLSISNVIWIPLIWMFILASRSISSWANITAELPELSGIIDGNPIDRNILILFIIIGIVILIKLNVNWIEIIKNNKMIFVFLLYCFISFIWSDYPFVSVKRLIRTFGLIVMVLILKCQESPVDYVAAILRRIAVVLPLGSLLLIKYFPEYGRYYSRWSYETIYSGISDNKNGLGAACLISATILLWEICKRWKEKKKLLKSLEFYIYSVLIVINIYLLKLADSSTATLCLILSLIILVTTNINYFKQNIKSITKWLAIVLAIFSIMELFFDITTEIILALGRNVTLTDRTLIWNLTTSLVSNPFVGEGYGSFWLGERVEYIWEEGYRILQAHSGYVETYLNLGLIGVGLFLGIIIVTFTRCIKICQSNFYYGQLLLTLFIIFIFYNITEGAFPKADFMTYILFIVTIEPHYTEMYHNVTHGRPQYGD